MNKSMLHLMLAVVLGCAVVPVFSAETNDVKAQLQGLVGKIRAQIQMGKSNENDLAPLIKEFDVLLTQHHGGKTEEVARILRMKALLYWEVFQQGDKAIELFQQLKRDFPQTELGRNADQEIGDIQKRMQAIAIQNKLVVGALFPDFAEKDLKGKPLSIAKYKGKVLLIDFWATWCAPCVREMPNILKAYRQYHAKGFEIIGISLDTDEARLKSFIKDKAIPWPQYFDGYQAQHKLSRAYGVITVPVTYLLNGEGRIVARDLQGDDLSVALKRLFAKP